MSCYTRVFKKLYSLQSADGRVNLGLVYRVVTEVTQLVVYWTVSSGAWELLLQGVRPSPYRAVNTLRFSYKNQPVNVV